MEPEKIGRYEIQGVLGQGAMGLVYKAYDPRLERYAAIKVMSGQVDEELLTRFFHEARSAAKLNHPNIISVYDLGEGEEQPFIAMEYLEGEDLKAINQKAHTVPFAQKLTFIIQIAEALDFAHRHGVVHRDIKPGNVFITPTQELKILDFGLARLTSSEMTKSGVLMGSPYYMSPEQVTGQKDVDGRSDLFSVGVILYELVCSKRPFEGESITSVCFQIISEPHESVSSTFPGCSPELSKIVDRALAKNRDERYQSGSELAAELERFRDQLPVVQDSLVRSIDTLEKRVGYLVEKGHLTREQARAARVEIEGDANDYTNLLRYHTALKQTEKSRDSAAPPALQPPPAAAEAESTQPLESTSPVSPPAAGSKPAPDQPQSAPSRAQEPATPRFSGRSMILAALAAVVLVVVAAGLWSSGPPSLGGGGSLSLDVSPWAQIESITDIESGRTIPIEAGLSTPCVVPLAAGRYQVRVSNPFFGGPLEFEVGVSKSGTSHVHQKLPGFDLEREVLDAIDMLAGN